MSFVSELFKSCYIDFLSRLEYCQNSSWMPLLAASTVAAIAIPTIVRCTNIVSYGRSKQQEISDLSFQFSNNTRFPIAQLNTITQSFSNIDPLIKVVKFPENKTQMVTHVGQNIGFQNGGIECALCCALYGLFATTDIFDSIFLEDPYNQDNAIQRNIRNQLIEIINLMRTDSSVEAQKIENFKILLMLYGDLTAGLTDPEAVINSIVKALRIPLNTIVVANLSFSIKEFQKAMNAFLDTRKIETLEFFTSENTRVLIVQAQNQPGEKNEHIPSLQIQVEGKNYRLAAINVHVNRDHYVTYSLLPEQRRIFKFDPCPGESKVEYCDGLFDLIETQYSKETALDYLYSNYKYKNIKNQWDQITHAAQYVYVRS